MLRFLERRGSNCHKYDSDGVGDCLPMTIADMDVATPDCVHEAIMRRARHGAFGYTFVPQGYYDSVVNWFGRRHGWEFDTGDIVYTTGVVPAISSVLRALTLPGDGVITQTPAYNCFFSSVRNMGCELLRNPLIHSDGGYVIDFEGLERLASHERARVILLCNPHNPSCRVWSREELGRVVDIARRHKLWIVSDEIHCEFVQRGFCYTPVALVANGVHDRVVVCASPSKAFNIAGLQTANIICGDDEARERIVRAVNIHETCDLNPFGVEALMAAYSAEGAKWLCELNEHIGLNYGILRDALHELAPTVGITRLEGTYLAWLDVSNLGRNSEDVVEHVARRGKVLLNAGSLYGDDGEGFVRVNMACAGDVMAEASRRIAMALGELAVEQ